MQKKATSPSLLTDAVRAMIGISGPIEVACDAVEKGAVRRFAQAIMDDDPRYGADVGAVAPPLFPLSMFRRPLGTADPFAEHADNPKFDGIVGSNAQGLPSLPVGNLALLNGGLEIEMFRYARHGEVVTAQSRYLNITERQSSKGPMLLVEIETLYRGVGDEPIMRAIKTLIRR